MPAPLCADRIHSDRVNAFHPEINLPRPDELTTPPKLKKAIGGLGFFSLAFGSMIGVGWVTALGGWFEQAGPGGAILAFCAGGLLMLLIGLCYAEVTPMLPVTGGEVAYSYKAYGTGEAFVVGWFLAFGYLSVSAFEAVSVGRVLAYMRPELNVVPLYTVGESTVYAPHLVLAFVFTAVITLINYLGVTVATRVQVVLTLSLLTAAAVFVVAGVAGGHAENLSPLFASDHGGQSFKGILAVFVTVPFWFVGFDIIPQAAEERREAFPMRRLGVCVIVAIIGSTVFYVAIILAAGMTTPWRSIVEAELPTAAAFESAFSSPFLSNPVLFAGLIGLLTSWNGFFLAGSRVLFALGRGHIIHAAFGRTHPRHRTPRNAVLFSGVVTCLAACLGHGAMLAFVNVGSFCIAIAFLGVALSLVRLRQRFPHLRRPYRMPGGKVVAYAAALGSLGILLVMLCPGSPGMLAWPLEWLILLSMSMGGVWCWFAGRPSRDRIAESSRARLILDDYV